jgi:hypothetical protein
VFSGQDKGMDPRALLDQWLATGALRPSTQAAYRQEVTSWLDWCDHTWPHPGPVVDPYHFGIEHVAAWSYDRYLRDCLGNRPFDGPAALAYIAEQFPHVAKSHDRRITALTQFYNAAVDHRVLRIAPDLTELRSGVDRDDTPPKRLDPLRAGRPVLRHRRLGPFERPPLPPRPAHRLPPPRGPQTRRDHPSGHPAHLRTGRLHLRAARTRRLRERGQEVHPRTPHLPALKAYLPKRIRPADGVHALIIGQGGQPIVREYPNKIVQQICATYPILAQRQPPVTADTIAHTGYWDTPPAG